MLKIIIILLMNINKLKVLKELWNTKSCANLLEALISSYRTSINPLKNITGNLAAKIYKYKYILSFNYLRFLN